MDPGIVATAVAIAVNEVYAIRHKHSPWPIAMGGAVLLLFVSAMDSVGSGMGTAVGTAFLLGTLIYRGEDLIALLTGLMGG